LITITVLKIVIAAMQIMTGMNSKYNGNSPTFMPYLN